VLQPARSQTFHSMPPRQRAGRVPGARGVAATGTSSDITRRTRSVAHCIRSSRGGPAVAHGRDRQLIANRAHTHSTK
jgi:hypothetical protein